METCRALRRLFLAASCDLYLSLESDVIVEADTIPRMLAALESEYVDAVYANCYRQPEGHGFLPSTVPCFTSLFTMGCTLFRRRVLEQIDFRYDPNLLGAFPDAFFSHDFTALGFKCWYDPTIWLEHAHRDGGTEGGRGWENIDKDDRRKS